MKKMIFYCMMLLLISCSDNPFGWWKNPNKIIVEGRVVETFYTNNIIFSVVPLAGVEMRLGHEIVDVTDNYGRYSFTLLNKNEYMLYAEKSGYITKSMKLDLVSGPYKERDFHLERVDETSPGWLSSPPTSDGARIMITADGLCVYSLGKSEVFATKTINLPNNKSYRFVSSVLKDQATQYIYFGVQPQISGHAWVTDSTNLNRWREIGVYLYINDTRIIRVDNVYDNDGNLIGTVNVYPETVDVVLKIGVEGGTNYPIGYFREIRIE